MKLISCVRHSSIFLCLLRPHMISPSLTTKMIQTVYNPLRKPVVLKLEGRNPTHEKLSQLPFRWPESLHNLLRMRQYRYDIKTFPLINYLYFYSLLSLSPMHRHGVLSTMAWTYTRCMTPSSTILKMLRVQRRRRGVNSCSHGGIGKMLSFHMGKDLIWSSRQVFPESKVEKTSNSRSNTLKLLNGAWRTNNKLIYGYVWPLSDNIVKEWWSHLRIPSDFDACIIYWRHCDCPLCW